MFAKLLVRVTFALIKRTVFINNIWSFWFRVLSNFSSCSYLNTRNMSELSESASSPSTIELYCPIEQTWTITEEKLKEMKDENDYYRLRSDIKEVVAVPHVKYNLLLTRRTANSGKQAFHLYLDVFTPKISSRIHAKYSFFIKSENYVTQFNNVFFNESNAWGDEICHVEEFFDSRRKFVVDGKLTVQMKGILIFNDVPMAKMIPAEKGPLVQQLWKSDDKEFKIVVGNEGNVMIHKCVLSARSDSFQAMFRSGREEEKTNTLKIIDFHLKIVELAVEFFYDRNIFDTLDLDDAFELVRFADKYIINDLQDNLETYVTCRLSPSSVCDLANRSITANSIKLRQICFNFMMICFRHGISVDHLDILDKEFAAELFNKMLSSSFD